MSELNQTLKTIEQRYSCRNFDGGKKIEKSKLEAIAAAAVQSPSGMNNQPWRIVVITDKAFIDEMDGAAMKILAEAEDKTAYDRFMERGGRLYYNAPCMFLILKRPGSDLDCGIVTENIALAAESLGVANVICGMAGIAFGMDNEKGGEFRKKALFYDFGEGWEFGMAVLAGYAKETKEPHEPDMSKIKFV
jgi:nitroreductase